MFSALTLKVLVRHISVQHAGMPNFKITCLVHGCPEQYDKMNSFRKHLRKFHAEDLFNTDHQPPVEEPEVNNNNMEAEELPNNSDDPFSSCSSPECESSDDPESDPVCITTL